MKKTNLLLFVLIVFVTNLFSKEGMWMPFFVDQIDFEDLRESGFTLSPEELYSINQACLTDAIVLFDGICTGELISDKGLVLTNHHCGLDRVQQHSTLNNNYLKDGFWARNQSEELPNKDISVLFLKQVLDITNTVLNGIPENLETNSRNELVWNRIDSVTTVLSDSLKADVSIEKFYYGNQYFAFVYSEYTDVRLVGAPPMEIGNFGGDTDNWVWPRHTGDFSLFRIYTGTDGKPADYSESNIPYTSKAFLPIYAGGVDTGNFTMVLGYPARTQSYLYSEELRILEDNVLPALIDLRQGRLEEIDLTRAVNEQVYIQYASKQKSISNAWKKWRGILYGFNKADVVSNRIGYENWLEQVADDNQKEEIQQLHNSFADVYSEFEGIYFAFRFFNESVFRIEPLDFYRDEVLPNAKNNTQIDILVAKEFFKNYNASLDKKISTFIIAEFISEINPQLIPETLKELNSDDDVEEYVRKVYQKSSLVDSSRFFKALEKYTNGNYTTFNNDPFAVLFTELAELYYPNVLDKYYKLAYELDNLYTQYIPLIQQIDTNRKFYPDANFTLRVSYGKVGGYTPKDGVYYTHQTYLDGIIEKNKDKSVADYTIPERLLDLYGEADYGAYADDTGMLPVCFIASNHTSGGNSGSPVLNGKGQLIGLNFDRVWEGTMSDYNFDENICRNIAVDIRYILFIIDKYANCSYLLDEMKVHW